MNAFDTTTIIDAALYDTEIIESNASRPQFFSNTRAFADRSPKALHEHTNLVSSGSLPMGYSIVAKAIAVELDDEISDSDRALVLASELNLNVGPYRAVDRVKIADAVRPKGAPLAKPREIIELQTLSVSLDELPVEIEGPFRMKVMLLGAFVVPIPDGSSALVKADKKRAKEIYGRKEPTSLAAVWIHLACVEANEALVKGPLTRRAYESHRVRSLDLRGAPKSDRRRNTRRAWWCHRCHAKVKQGDQIAAVKARS